MGKTGITSCWACCLMISILSTVAIAGQSDRGKIVGRVVDQETFKTLPAELAIAGRDSRTLFLRHTRASESGLFEIADLPAGDFYLTTKLKGYATDHLSVSLNGGETRYVEFYLERGRTVRGVVYDQSQKPVSGARVSVTYAADEDESSSVAASYQWEQAEAETDQSGRFEINNLHPQKRFTIEASSPGFLPATSTPMKFNSMDQEPSLKILLRSAQ